MKRRNNKKSLMQQGGLMIEALAMLGLIAVVTPTMYKKSAERTMEVEDINSATTIRTIMNAANDYVGANYSTIISDMNKESGDAAKYRKITKPQIEPYLPYGFNMDKALYNYDFPELAIAKNDNNLTTFALFPAKASADTGIGQERTSRIASLVGASGGYVTGEKKARGIGGIWKLENDDFSKVFPNNASANTYSIVTASADTINAATGNEIDMDKYLQRGRDDNDDDSTLWKNTMRTDLYMGENKSADDVYQNNDVQDKTYSIRNIKSLIVGAEHANTNGTDDIDGYGLYMQGDSKNAYIDGTLEAVNSDFKVLQNALSFGRTADADGNKGDYAFTVNSEGDTYTKGSLTNDKNVYLANKYGEDGWQNIKMGVLDDNDDDDTNYIIQAYHDDSDNRGHITLLGSGSCDSRNIATFNSYGSTVWDLGCNNKVADNDDRIVFLEDGWKRLGRETSDEKVEAPKYSGNEPYFPMRVGANAKYEGLLAAGQIDTQKIRTASLSVGSENIDDSEKWLNVDKTGVVIRDIHREDNEDYDPWGTYASFNKNGILLRADEERHYVSDDDRGEDFGEGGKDTSEHEVQLNLRVNKDFAGGPNLSNVAELFGEHTDIRGKEMARISGQGTIIQAKSDIPDWEEDYSNGWKEETADYRDTVDPNTLVLRNDNMQAEMKDKQLTIEGRTDDDGNKNAVRTLFNKGDVDLDNTNFAVVTGEGEDRKYVFDVHANSNYSKNSFSSFYPFANYAANQAGYIEPYDVTMHGNILMADSTTGKTSDFSFDKGQYYVSMGTYNSRAAINIVPYTKDSSNNDTSSRIVYVDQGGSYEDDRNHNALADQGTVYIRKGYVEVKGDDKVKEDAKTDALGGNGVIVASRLVANNPSDENNVFRGAEVKDIFTSDAKTRYGLSNNRYDTYMVNPAYTSVMHDIKLTTRGGARLSDVLPDFINKGIYVVNNTMLESKIAGLDAISSYSNAVEKMKNPEINIDLKGKVINLGDSSAWASPFLGAVPAPQCPPGYGRVITLNPSGFQMAQAGSLHSSGTYKVGEKRNSGYYVAPYTLPEEIEKENGEKITLMEAEPIMEAADVDISNIKADGQSVTGTAKTSKYVLTAQSPNVKPLVFQQSTWLKSMVTPLKDGNYTQGWKAIMGFLYPETQFKAFVEGNGILQDTEAKVYWNLFPVALGTLEGYATVYCYFDRTNMLPDSDGTKDFNNDYTNYVDSYSYMQTMGVVGDDADVSTKIPSSYEKIITKKYKDRLNDPNLKYDEVW